VQARLIQPDTYCRKKGRGASRISSRQQIAARSAQESRSAHRRNIRDHAWNHTRRSRLFLRTVLRGTPDESAAAAVQLACRLTMVSIRNAAAAVMWQWDDKAVCRGRAITLHIGSDVV